MPKSSSKLPKVFNLIVFYFKVKFNTKNSGKVKASFVGIVMYLLDKLKPFKQKEHFFLKEQNGLGWNLAYVCVGPEFKWDSNSGPPG